MNDTLIYILQNILVIDVLILIVWALDKSFHWNIGHLWRKWIWLLICLRMLFPIEIHLQDFNESWKGIHIELEMVVQEDAEVQNSLSSQTKESRINGLQIYEPVSAGHIRSAMAETESTAAKDTNEHSSIMDFLKKYLNLALLGIWFLGFLIALFFHIFQYYFVKDFYFEDAIQSKDAKLYSFTKQLCKKHHIHRMPQLLEKEDATTPMTCGYFQKKLVYPPNVYDEYEMKLILQHELMHMKYFDPWYKTFVLIICDLYWFNPVFLLMKQMAYQDVEYVCDERVVKEMLPEEKKLYGTAIMKTVHSTSGRAMPSVVQFSVNKKELKNRLNNLFEFKNWYKGMIPLAVAFLVTAILTISVTINVKEVTAEESKGTQGRYVYLAEDAIAATYYTDDLNALNTQKDVESSYITERFTGFNHYYIDKDGVLWGTGSNTSWQLGIAEENDIENLEVIYSEPVRIAEDVIHVDVNINSEYVIYLTSSGELYGLGENVSGVLRLPIDTQMKENRWWQYTAKPQLLMTNVAFASAGQQCISVLTKDGGVLWWGELSATAGTVGHEGNMYAEEPTLMVQNARYTVCVDDTIAAIDNDNNLWLWGCNVWGECGKDGADYLLKPNLACTDVEMVWTNLLSTRQNIFNVEHWMRMNPYLMSEDSCSHEYTTFIRKTDGKMYACGIDLGHSVKSVMYYGDLYVDDSDYPENYTREYSTNFLPISVEEMKSKEP